MSLRLKKAILVAIAAFITAATGYTIAPEALESLCIKINLCEVAK